MVPTVNTSPPSTNETAGGPHPNELDLRRIAHMLEKRTRYRYVKVRVLPVDRGYLVVSPCCSRTVEPHGGMIDIALIEFDESMSRWKLFSKDHDDNRWRMHITSDRLGLLIDCLNADYARLFWQ